MKIYRDSFEASARQPLSVIRRRVSSRKEMLLVGIMGKRVICFALLWRLKGTGFVLLDYLAVKGEYRSRSIGSKFMRFIASAVRSSGEKLIIEVDDPKFGRKRRERKRRVLFYKRCGAHVLKDVQYFLRPLNPNMPHKLILMIMPGRRGSSLKGEFVTKTVTQIYKEVYHRGYRDPIVQSTLSSIGKVIVE
jgi:GNAT superfamily N-acetyltransferase